MQEGKRQKQVAAVIQQEMNDIFMRLGLNMMDGGMVSISSVKVTPDLLEARIYLSFFKVTDGKAAIQKIKAQAWKIKEDLGSRVKNQLRRIPVLQFYIDDTLDYVFKMEDVFKQISQEDGVEKDENS